MKGTLIGCGGSTPSRSSTIKALDTESARSLVPRSPSNLVQLKRHLTNATSRLTSVSINAKLYIVLLKYGKPNLSMGRFLVPTTTSSYIGQMMLMIVVAPLRGKFISRPRLSKWLSKDGVFSWTRASCGRCALFIDGKFTSG